MPALFEDERKYPDNSPRSNFVFMGYPHRPPLAPDDYNTVVKELQEELPLRLWYFTDELTTEEMMRKIWRAILRADLCVFDISGGNPNVAFELGLAVAENKKCISFLKTGEPNPLGSADLGYAERAEYQSAATLKAKLRDLCIAKSSALRVLKDLSYKMHDEFISQDFLEGALREVVRTVFRTKKITKDRARRIFDDTDKLADLALNRLRESDVLRVEGAKRGAVWVFTDKWVVHDHEVVGA